MQPAEDNVETEMIDLMSKIDNTFHNLHDRVRFRDVDKCKQWCNEILINTNKLLNEYTNVLTNDEKCAVKFKQHWIYGFMAGRYLAIDEDIKNDIMYDNYASSDGYYDLVFDHKNK